MKSQLVLLRIRLHDCDAEGLFLTPGSVRQPEKREYMRGEKSSVTITAPFFLFKVLIIMTEPRRTRAPAEVTNVQQCQFV